MAAVESVQSEGKICILDIDVQGVQNVKKSQLKPIYVFIAPPSMDDLESRLRGRGTESEEDIVKRLANAAEEMAYGEGKGNFDCVFTNDDLEKTFGEMVDKFKGWFPKLIEVEDVAKEVAEENVETSNDEVVDDVVNEIGTDTTSDEVVTEVSNVVETADEAGREPDKPIPQDMDVSNKSPPSDTAAAISLNIDEDVNKAEKPQPVVFCGPSGVGKGTLIDMLMKRFPNNQFGFSVSHTTRKPREGEEDGVHYNFTNVDKIKGEIEEGKFIEYAEVHGNYYGTR